jgi:hypothetical protein
MQRHGKTWHWCEYHMMWCIHTTDECRLNPKNAGQNIQANNAHLHYSNQDEDAPTQLEQMMATIAMSAGAGWLPSIAEAPNIFQAILSEQWLLTAIVFIELLILGDSSVICVARHTISSLTLNYELSEDTVTESLAVTSHIAPNTNSGITGLRLECGERKERNLENLLVSTIFCGDTKQKSSYWYLPSASCCPF